MKTLFSILLLSAVVLPGCSTVGDAVGGVMGDTARTTQVAATRVAGAVTREDAPDSLRDVGRPDDVGDAVMTPVRDLNLRKVDVPDVLLRIERPYEVTIRGCRAVVDEIHALDAALGPDYDRLPLPESDSRMQRAGLGLIGSAMGDLIPFRSVVRRVSGASARENELREFYRVGIVRRGFLRGIARERGC